jgi:hypothetical protein
MECRFWNYTRKTGFGSRQNNPQTQGEIDYEDEKPQRRAPSLLPVLLCWLRRLVFAGWRMFPAPRMLLSVRVTR